MMTRSIKIAAIAAGLATVPLIGAAANSPAALNSCTRAFMADLSSKIPKTLKLRDAHYIAGGRAGDTNLLVLGGTSELTLTARDAHDNHAVARAVCTVNWQGDVVELRAAPLFSMDDY
jgi:hypothetical protein